MIPPSLLGNAGGLGFGNSNNGLGGSFGGFSNGMNGGLAGQNSNNSLQSLMQPNVLNQLLGLPSPSQGQGLFQNQSGNQPNLAANLLSTITGIANPPAQNQSAVNPLLALLQATAPVPGTNSQTAQAGLDMRALQSLISGQPQPQPVPQPAAGANPLSMINAFGNPSTPAPVGGNQLAPISSGGTPSFPSMGNFIQQPAGFDQQPPMNSYQKQDSSSHHDPRKSTPQAKEPEKKQQIAMDLENIFNQLQQQSSTPSVKPQSSSKRRNDYGSDGEDDVKKPSKSSHGGRKGRDYNGSSDENENGENFFRTPSTTNNNSGQRQSNHPQHNGGNIGGPQVHGMQGGSLNGQQPFIANQQQQPPIQQHQGNSGYNQHMLNEIPGLNLHQQQQLQALLLNQQGIQQFNQAPAIPQQQQQTPQMNQGMHHHHQQQQQAPNHQNMHGQYNNNSHSNHSGGYQSQQHQQPSLKDKLAKQGIYRGGK
ncbi:hypothetical protein FGO68_gene11595 [Halteria grandinella]|uniref:Uncharacterized protein n=1 Tax=Halteria grandinella TaxID=5974 RepID=A0A8J8T8P6_HALGN|nr:hypothetical protein FGO68_gene11595 [Halteria grandinella]